MGLSWGGIAKGFAANLLFPGSNVGTLSVANQALDGGLGQAVAYGGLGFNGLFGSNRCLDFANYGAAQFAALDRYLGGMSGCSALPMPALQYGAYPWGGGRDNVRAEQGVRTLLAAEDRFQRGDIRGSRGFLDIAKAMFDDMSPDQRASFMAQGYALAPEAFTAMLLQGDGSGIRRYDL